MLRESLRYIMKMVTISFPPSLALPSAGVEYLLNINLQAVLPFRPQSFTLCPNCRPLKRNRCVCRVTQGASEASRSQQVGAIKPV